MRPSVRLTFRFDTEQNGIIECLTELNGGGHITSQICDCDDVLSHAALSVRQVSDDRQGPIDDATIDSRTWGAFKINNRRVRQIFHEQSCLFRDFRLSGCIDHDGISRYWPRQKLAGFL